MPDGEIPLEVAMDEIKTCMAKYASALCQEYKIHPAIMIQILQEIVYENRLNNLSQLLLEQKAKNSETKTIDFTPNTPKDGKE